MFIEPYAYMPQQTIDRAAMAKLISLATTLINSENIAEKNTASFADIDGNWAEKHIEYCVDKGIIDGKTATIFDPSGSVTGIETAKMLLAANGHGLNDFAGHAAGIMATDNANVTIDNATIHTTGAIRTGIWAGGNSTLLIKNSTIIGKDGTDLNFKAGMFKEVPWVLGLKGNLRVTNVQGRQRYNQSQS
ncbi:S-layer homology domain-containing protein [Biomaibacter acetigenes]|nr:S-layer homology domain-containing protein [Biomaibacter acetigenes]